MLTRAERQLRTALQRSGWARTIIGLTMPARIIHEAVLQAIGPLTAEGHGDWCEEVAELFAASIHQAWEAVPVVVLEGRRRIFKRNEGYVLQGQVKSHLLADCYARDDKPGRSSVYVAGAGWLMLADLAASGRLEVYEGSPAAKGLEMIAPAISEHPEWPNMERSATKMARRWIAQCEGLGLYPPASEVAA